MRGSSWVELSHLGQYTETQIVSYLLVLIQHLSRKYHIRAPHLAWISPDPPVRFHLTSFAIGFATGALSFCALVIYILFY